KIWDKPSSPCMATRIPYDTPLDENVLHAADSAERILLKKGLKVVRVRVHGDIARIEAEDINAAFTALDKETTEKIKRCGFKFVCIYAEGYRKGCFD
ncbi:MAG: TIGR00268 family protein, partial [Clostridia bacterium]|nr:TIGR00268 family protein [Clostridia bacterium]